MKIFNSLRFHTIRLLSLKKLKDNKLFDKSAVYLTFDDGPEPGITEFVLDELKKYNAKATFFCKGENCEKHTELLNRIVGEGHTIANHTFSHINGWETPFKEYIANVEKCEKAIGTHIFRPPWGKLTFKQYRHLSNNNKIVLWDIVSGDTELDKFNLNKSLQNLKAKTQKGSIVLFHFCKRHEKETRQILPLYLEFLKQENYATSTIAVK